GNFVRTLTERQGLQSGCPEEIAYESGWIDADAVRARAEMFAKNSYGEYLLRMLEG
ncbi:MAG: glucose-1-phosphate thymidylyltransferase, partial [Ascidiaceihabitans sp.]